MLKSVACIAENIGTFGRNEKAQGVTAGKMRYFRGVIVPRGKKTRHYEILVTIGTDFLSSLDSLEKSLNSLVG